VKFWVSGAGLLVMGTGGHLFSRSSTACLKHILFRDMGSIYQEEKALLAKLYLVAGCISVGWGKRLAFFIK
jgi:hypothetical protein